MNRLVAIYFLQIFRTDETIEKISKNSEIFFRKISKKYLIINKIISGGGLGSGRDWWGITWLGCGWLAMLGLGPAWFGPAWLGPARVGPDWVGPGLVWPWLAWPISD